MKKLSIACGLLIASGSLFAQQYTISTIAGTGTAGWSGDQGPAIDAQFSAPIRVALDSAGNIYVTDLNNSSIRKILTDGNITSVTGNGQPGFSGDGGPSSGAGLASPHDIALDSSNNLYIADTGNSRIRIVSAGIINTFAGTTRGTEGADLGDGGPAIDAQLIEPTGVAVDPSGNVYIADIGNATVRKVAPNGVISTFAGTGFLSFGAFTGEGGPATQALLGEPYSLATDNAGNVYIVDIGLGRLFRVDTGGLIHTVEQNFVGDNVAVDAAGNIYAAVFTNSTVQKIVTGGTTLWIGGDGASGYAGDGGVGTTANMGEPYGVAVDPAGNVYAAESLNSVVRKLTPVPFSIGAIANSATNQPFAAPYSAVGDPTVPISPGEIVTLFGTGLGPATLVVNSPQGSVFGTQLAGTTVNIGGYPAPIIYASSQLVSAIVPYEVSGMTSANVYVTYQGQQSVVNTVKVSATAPGVFTLDSSGFGQALAIDPGPNGWTLYSGSNAPSPGDTIVLYATGEGLTTPGGVDGQLTPDTLPLHVPIQPVAITVGGISAVVTPVEAPDIVAGVLQLNVQIPAGVPAGPADVILSEGFLTAPTVSITVGP